MVTSRPISPGIFSFVLDQVCEEVEQSPLCENAGDDRSFPLRLGCEDRFEKCFLRGEVVAESRVADAQALSDLPER